MSLNELRKEIDSLDEQMLELLNRRAKLAQEVGHTKSATRSHYFTPEREHNVFKKLLSMNNGPLETPAVRAIYR